MGLDWGVPGPTGPPLGDAPAVSPYLRRLRLAMCENGLHPLRSLVTSVLFWGPNWPRTEVTEDRSGWVISVPRTELHIRRTDLHLMILHAKCFEIDDCGRRGHSQKHYKRRSRLHHRNVVFANRVVKNFCYLRLVLIVPSVLRHWWRR